MSATPPQPPSHGSTVPDEAGHTPPGPVTEAELRHAAGAEHLLVVSDFDGVLAPFVDDPADSAPVPESMAALEELAGLPDTTVALVSGRGRDDLAARSGASPRIELIGSHGSEWQDGFLSPMTDADRERLTGVVTALNTIAERFPGSFVEVKQASAALHHRTLADPEGHERVRRAVLTGPAAADDVHVTAGKNVVEIAVVATSKGTALQLLVERITAESVAPVTVFCGDDVTDERGFAVMGPRDLSIKVGDGETFARLRVPDIPAAGEVYRRLARLRADHDRSPHRDD